MGTNVRDKNIAIFEELEFMDDDERREILEAAGLDPNEFDF